MTLSTFL
jgi:hypothetical protein